MKNASVHLIYQSVSEANILPLTSLCNVRCVFCSHRQNPPGTQVYRIAPLTGEQAADALQFVDPDRKIVIGESVTRIIEGEPFTHPRLRDILRTIRTGFPDTPIQITTNGTLLDEEAAAFLAALGGVEINLSLNSADPAVRKKLMADELAHRAVRAPGFLAAAGIPFHGSVVAMPHLFGWADLDLTLSSLAADGAATIRVFLPGFTDLAPPELKFNDDLWHELNEFAAEAARRLKVPITTEPPEISDLKPQVKGVIRGSAAHRAGLLPDDIILGVDGKPCLSRVDAFNRIRVPGDVMLDVLREGKNIGVLLAKEPGAAPGLVMDYDLDPALLDRVGRAAAKYRRPVMLCSALAAPVMRMALARGPETDISGDLQVITVPSRFFGGSIKCAGLLTVSDFVQEIEKAGCHREAVFLLPGVAFDRQGRDITGISWHDIEERTGYKTEII